jgi:uncharacterized protein YutD
MKTIMSIIAFAVISNYAHAFDDVQVLSAIGQVETGMDYSAVGDNGLSLGAFQLRRSGWVDGCTQLMREGKKAISYDDWKYATNQDTVALALLRSLRGRLASKGITDPTPEQLALCWNMGFTAASRIGFDHHRAKSDYAERVGNLTRK